MTDSLTNTILFQGSSSSGRAMLMASPNRTAAVEISPAAKRTFCRRRCRLKTTAKAITDAIRAVKSERGSITGSGQWQKAFSWLNGAGGTRVPPGESLHIRCMAPAILYDLNAGNLKELLLLLMNGSVRPESLPVDFRQHCVKISLGNDVKIGNASAARTMGRAQGGLYNSRNSSLRKGPWTITIKIIS